MRVKKFDKGARLLVTWEDITQDAAWHNQKKLKEASTCIVQTLGFFLINKNRQLKLAHSIAEDGDCDVTCIPWGVIKGVTEWPQPVL